jgi:3-oxoacyl-[acyl-carrier-protein] synthase II
MSSTEAVTLPPIELITDRRLTPAELEQLANQARFKRPRIVITGMGAITPLGLSAEEFWQNLLAGKSGIAPVTLFDTKPYKTKIAGEVKGFDPRRYFDFKEARRVGRATWFAVGAAKDAVADAGIADYIKESTRAGVLIGNSIGGFVEGIQEHDVFIQKGPDRVSPLLASYLLPNMPAFYIANHLRVRGPNSTISTACAAGTQAIGEAAEWIRHGSADIMLTGGAEAIISEMAFAGFGAMRATSTRNDDPTRASRPFDKDRDGFVLGEGAAILVLERLDHAIERGAKIYAEILGSSQNSDAFHFAAPDPQGVGATLVMRQAIRNAGLSIHDIDYINAHGTSTSLNDASETVAIKQVFGERAYSIPVSSTKSMTGHSMGAAGAFEAVACAMTLRDQRIHPTVNYENPDPTCDLDYVPNCARDMRVSHLISNSFGLGGQNACLVMGRYNHHQ